MDKTNIVMEQIRYRKGKKRASSFSLKGGLLRRFSRVARGDFRMYPPAKEKDLSEQILCFLSYL